MWVCICIRVQVGVFVRLLASMHVCICVCVRASVFINSTAVLSHILATSGPGSQGLASLLVRKAANYALTRCGACRGASSLQYLKEEKSATSSLSPMLCNAETGQQEG